MSASPNGFDADPKRASEAGKKSKKKPLDVKIAEFFENFISDKIKEGDNRSRMELMFTAAYQQFIKGNSKPLAYLIDRGFGKPKSDFKIEHSADTELLEVIKQSYARRKND
jgi:hypothetical protein